MIPFLKKNRELILIILITNIAAFIRLYGLSDGIPFTFDQAEFSFYVRDILNGKPVLIGPRTGIEGFFLGPLYFYLLVPFYWLTKGHPVAGAYMDALFGILVIPAIYLLGKEMFDKKVGVIASLLACFSPNFISNSRFSWNPHPLLLFSIIFYYSILKVLKGEEKYIIFSFFAFSCGLQFEIASAIFYIPTVFLIFFWTKYRPKKIIYWLLGLLILLISLIPQLAFNLRHEWLTVKALIKYLSKRESFTNDYFYLISARFNQYFDAFREVVFSQRDILFPLFLLFSGFYFLYKELNKNPIVTKLLFCWLTVNFFFLFFSGERVWPHHFISLFPAFILISALSLKKFLEWKNDGAISYLIFFLVVFINIYNVWSNIWPKKTTHTDERIILFKHQLAAIDYIYKESKGEPFNVFIYVPCVYDHSYRYIFEWYGKKTYGYLPTKDKKEKLVYFIIEEDYEIPARKTNWLYTKRNEGEIQKVKAFGGALIVEKRIRREILK